MWSPKKKTPISPAAPQALGDEPKLELAPLQEGMSSKLKGYCRRLSAAGNNQAQNGLQVMNPALLLFQLQQGSSCMQELAQLQEGVEGEIEGYPQQLIAVRDVQVP